MLTKATTGDLAGYTTVPVDAKKLLQYTDLAVAKGVRYFMGAKCPPGHLADSSIPYHRIDCSGFARCLLAFSTAGLLIVPDGSWVQEAYFASHGFKETDPQNCALPDGHIRICFHLGDQLDPTGHVWIVPGDAKTLESYGGHGPGRRSWNAHLSSGHTLDQLATHCYVLA